MGVSEGVSGRFRDCSRWVSGVFQGGTRVFQRFFQGSFEIVQVFFRCVSGSFTTGFPGVLQLCFISATDIFPGDTEVFRAVKWWFYGIFRGCSREFLGVV